MERTARSPPVAAPAAVRPGSTPGLLPVRPGSLASPPTPTAPAPSPAGFPRMPAATALAPPTASLLNPLPTSGPRLAPIMLTPAAAGERGCRVHTVRRERAAEPRATRLGRRSASTCGQVQQLHQGGAVAIGGQQRLGLHAQPQCMLCSLSCCPCQQAGGQGLGATSATEVS
ncbi:hypothetical protein HaLaN_08891 [Haematococcus lacustris]|uniref:Uncharacterized protein n=1 Tax=Haematococcus lacustris TaxID=44745 RepID=A0A699ZC87_HAELA|nr:hypothetical protein HaLaN_08891 [Haematococcus lacustris]